MANRSVNKVILLGRTGKDAELSYTPGGAAVVKFSLATSRNWKDKDSGEWKEETDWHNIVWWHGEKASQYITKGTQLYIEGRLQTRSYEKDGKKTYVTEVIPDSVVMLGGNPADAGKAHHAEAAAVGQSARQYPPSKPISQSLEIDDSDIPF